VTGPLESATAWLRNAESAVDAVDRKSTEELSTERLVERGRDVLASR
jgi:hypothetical protein